MALRHASSAKTKASAIFRVERGEGGIAHLIADHPERKMNVIDEAAITALEEAISDLESEPPAGLILRSGKPGSFIAGADVEEIGAITEREKVLAVVRRAHAVFGRLASLPCPTVAAIDGVCLGGGTEIALACDSRIASEEAHTRIGFPEVLLGIFPAFGGATRLPRVVGLQAALDLILTGRALDAKRAARIGLIARAVPQAWLIEHAEKRIAELAAMKPERRADRFRPRGLVAWFLEGPLGRPIVFSQVRGMTKARTGGHYPAPLAALQVIEGGLGRPLAVGLELEAQWVSDLVTGPVCKNLVRIFQLSEETKKLAAPVGVEPLRVNVLALVGAGVMGGGIAELATRSGIEVRIRDIAPESLTKALLTMRSLIADRARKRRKSAAGETARQMAKVYPTLELTGMKRADLAIEAVVENLDIKRRVLAELEVRMRGNAILATNTSSLSVTELGKGLERPEQFCGLHFFNPVHRMPLVEVVRGAQSSAHTVTSAVELARRLGKTPVVVNDAPGFVVNRILMPYLREAMHLLEDGYPLRQIDASMRGFGMPMGPFEVLDEVGIDVAHKVAGVLVKAFPDRMSDSPALEKLLAAKRLGKKSGAGFYRHRGRKRVVDPELRPLLGLGRKRSVQSLEYLSERMVLAMVNEAARCLEERVVESAGMLDLAMVMGAGFAPFRGGPLRHADAIGLPKVEARLTALMAERGERFKPAALLTKLAAQGASFSDYRAA